MKKQTPYLDLYNKCCKLGRLPGFGLCGCIRIKMGYRSAIEFELLFKPSSDCIVKPISDYFWGTDDCYDMFLGFSPTRQNMLLLMAAMNDEF